MFTESCYFVIHRAELWHRFELERYRSNKEGWYLAMLHIPLMEVFRAIPYVDLCATDMKGRSNSNGGKHDAIIRHQVFPLDLVVMDHQQESPMLEDSEKISRSMAGNMQRAKELLPPSIREQKHDIMRSFGILCSGKSLFLLLVVVAVISALTTQPFFSLFVSVNRFGCYTAGMSVHERHPSCL